MPETTEKIHQYYHPTNPDSTEADAPTYVPPQEAAPASAPTQQPAPAAQYAQPPAQQGQQAFMPNQQHQVPGMQAPPGQGVDPTVQQGQNFQAMLMAQCANGNHQYNTSYGIIGIIVAVICCPCGLLALLVDRKKQCARCGHRLE